MLAFALGYYQLLLQVTKVHTMIEKTSRHPAHLALLSVLVPISVVVRPEATISSYSWTN